MYGMNNVNNAYNFFLKNYCDLYNKCCPVKKVKITNKNNKPWFTPSLSNACKEKRTPCTSSF